MDIRLLDHNKNTGKMSFIIKGSDTVFANLLRRYIIEKVPTMAIEDVEIKDNSSALYDEIVAHRLGLLPLSTDLKSYTQINSCKCGGEGCNRCTLKLTLKASGPGSVYASDLKSKDPKVKPIFPKTPIVKLLKDQKIELLATAVIGQGEDHVKFSPGFAYYKYKLMVTISKNPKNAEDIVKKCAAGVFEMKGSTLVVNQNNVMNAHLCDSCVALADPAGSIEIKDTEDIVFYVESWGQLGCKEMVITAFDQYAQDLDEFEKLVKDLK